MAVIPQRGTVRLEIARVWRRPRWRRPGRAGRRSCRRCTPTAETRRVIGGERGEEHDDGPVGLHVFADRLLGGGGERVGARGADRVEPVGEDGLTETVADQLAGFGDADVDEPFLGVWLRLSLLKTAARTAPPGRVMRASSVSPGTGSVRWLSTKAATVSSTEPSASGRARMSATAQGGRVAASQASMPADRSVASTRACCAVRAELAAPVPAPASSTVRPARECGLIATSSAAIGP